MEARRAEDLARHRPDAPPWDVVTARAVATTADLVELAFPLLAPGGTLIAWKRGDLTAELGPRGERSRRSAAGHFDVVDIPLSELGEHRLVVMDAIRRRHGPGRLPARPCRPQATAVVSVARLHGQ